MGRSVHTGVPTENETSETTVQNEFSRSSYIHVYHSFTLFTNHEKVQNKKLFKKFMTKFKLQTVNFK